MMWSCGPNNKPWTKWIIKPTLSSKDIVLTQFWGQYLPPIFVEARLLKGTGVVSNFTDSLVSMTNELLNVDILAVMFFT